MRVPVTRVSLIGAAGSLLAAVGGGVWCWQAACLAPLADLPGVGTPPALAQTAGQVERLEPIVVIGSRPLAGDVAHGVAPIFLEDRLGGRGISLHTAAPH